MWAKRPQGKDEGGGEKKTYRKTMEKRKKVDLVEINPSGFPKMMGKNKFEKGGTGVENGWGREMAHTQWAHKKKKSNFFFEIFCLEIFTLHKFLVHRMVNRIAFDSGGFYCTQKFLEASQDGFPHKK